MLRWGQWQRVRKAAVKRYRSEMYNKWRGKRISVKWGRDEAWESKSKRSTDQNSQAGGEEWRGEVDDLASGWINAKRRHCQVGSATEQIPHQSCPATVLKAPILPVAHNVEVKGEAHVLSQLLQQVDAVTVTTLLVVRGNRCVASF